MSYRLFQMLFLLEFSILNSFENEQLLCYSCKGIECEQITTMNENKILCNKKTQLCWAGFIDQQPYRTCASRYCTPNDFSLDSNIHIETCCRSDLCNSISLSQSYKQISSFHPKNANDVNSYDKGFSTPIASISRFLLFVMPLLLILFL